MREYITAAKEADEPEDEVKPIEFSVDGVLCTAYKPGDGQLAYLMASTGRHSSVQEQVAGIINFFVATLDDDSHQYLVGKLLDRTDPFGLEQVQEIMEDLTSEWTARPTKRPSGSTPSRRSTGSKSTRAIPQ